MTFTQKQLFLISQEFCDQGFHAQLINSMGSTGKETFYTTEQYENLTYHAAFRAAHFLPATTKNPVIDYLSVPDVLGIVSYNLFNALNEVYKDIFPFLLQVEMMKQNRYKEYVKLLEANGMMDFIVNIN